MIRNIQKIITSAVLGSFIGFIALLIAGYILLPKGNSLTYKETYEGQNYGAFPSRAIVESGNQEYAKSRVVDISLSANQGGRTIVTSEDYFPGLLAHVDIGSRVKYSLLLGGIMGVLAGTAIGFMAKSRSSKIIGLGGLAVGCFLEYHIESLLTIVLNSHSMDLSLLSFQVISSWPMQIIYDVECWIIVQALKPLDIFGFYLLPLIPMFFTILAILIGRFFSEEPNEVMV